MHILTEQEIQELYKHKRLLSHDWDYISARCALSEKLIEDFEKYINWHFISMSQNLSENFIRKYKHKLHWGYISKYQKLSQNFIREFLDKINITTLSTNTKCEFSDILPFLRKRKAEFISYIKRIPPRNIKSFFDNNPTIIDQIDESTITSLLNNVCLPEYVLCKIIENNKSNIDLRIWRGICLTQNLSEDFLRKYYHHIYWYHASFKQKLSTQFLKDFKDNIDWEQYSHNQHILQEHILEYYDKVNWESLYSHERLDKQFMQNLNKEQKLHVILNYRNVWEKFK